MRIYVTGGTGFIGSHLVDQLLARNHETTIIDNMSRGKNLPLTQGGWDLCLADLAEKCPDFEPHSVVFHLAAKVTGISYNIAHNFDMLHTNTAINQTVAASVAKSRPRLLVWVSTACVYPHDAPVPTPEEYGDVGNPEPTNHGYGVAKWHGEQLAKSLCREYGIPTIIVRFFNAFGERDHYDPETSHVAPALVKRVLDGENPVVVWGTGNQTRALVDAKDIARALVKLMDYGISFHPDSPIITNIGHEREVSMRELVETVIDLAVEEGLDTVPSVTYDLTRPDGYARRAASTRRLKLLIGWVPDTPLRQTLESMIHDYKRRFKQG